MSDERDIFGNPTSGYQRHHYGDGGGTFFDRYGKLRGGWIIVGILLFVAWGCISSWQAYRFQFSIQQAKTEVMRLVKASPRYEDEKISFVSTNKDGLFPDTHADIRIIFTIGEQRYIAECTGGYVPIVCDYYLSDIYNGEADR